MTVKEAAKRLDISVSKLYQLAGGRKIAHYRVGGKIVFDEEDIAAFLTGCRVAAAPAESTSPKPRLKLKHINLSRGS